MRPWRGSGCTCFEAPTDLSEDDWLNAALRARGWSPRRILKEATAALEHGQALTITPMGQHPEKTPESP